MTASTIPFAYCAIDALGQVVMRGVTLDLPQLEGLTVLPEAAPPGCYRDGDQWVPLPSSQSEHDVFDWSTKSFADPRSLNDIRALKLREINAAFMVRSAELTAGYPAAERQTWSAQESEALAWEADPTAPTVYLDGIAAVRGIDPADMRAKTLEAVTRFRAASQQLIGTRQALRDAITNPNATRAQIEAIAWPPVSQE